MNSEILSDGKTAFMDLEAGRAVLAEITTDTFAPVIPKGSQIRISPTKAVTTPGPAAVFPVHGAGLFAIVTEAGPKATVCYQVGPDGQDVLVYRAHELAGVFAIEAVELA